MSRNQVKSVMRAGKGGERALSPRIGSEAQKSVERRERVGEGEGDGEGEGKKGQETGRSATKSKADIRSDFAAFLIYSLVVHWPALVSF